MLGTHQVSIWRTETSLSDICVIYGKLWRNEGFILCLITNLRWSCCPWLLTFASMHESAHAASGSHFPSWQWHSMLRALKWIEGDYTLLRARSVIRSHYRLILKASPPRQQSFRAAEAERFGRFAAQTHRANYRPHARTCTDWNHQQVYCREGRAHSRALCLSPIAAVV